MAGPQKDFEELLKFFNSRGAKAVIAGAHAVAHHAKPRYTKALDVLVTQRLRMRGAFSTHFQISVSEICN